MSRSSQGGRSLLRLGNNTFIQLSLIDLGTGRPLILIPDGFHHTPFVFSPSNHNTLQLHIRIPQLGYSLSTLNKTKFIKLQKD